MIEMNVQLDGATTTVTLANTQGQLIFSPLNDVPSDAHTVVFYLKDRHLADREKADEQGVLRLPWTVEPEFVTRWLANQQGESPVTVIPLAQEKALAPYFDLLTQVLSRLGIHLAPVPAPTPASAASKPHPAKARHRFDKALVTTPFTVSRNGSRATVYWVAAKEMLVKAGAVLTQEPLMNKDGSLRYGTKYGDKLRDDNAGAIAHFMLIKDVSLRSVNEVGLFLYFGDTNGWLELRDAQGRTLDELTRVD
ncbi:hypothetical protein [Lacticaseibacillus mingshuiensis]|uniref:hypothetical protein n=1 Tax=Lacticaseibacillus mingshuiensis TaxID=2799574 RepID=UPI00194EA58D|nr:hypothetical protein [Lacticaseibacillus mingshuiensis]